MYLVNVNSFFLKISALCLVLCVRGSSAQTGLGLSHVNTPQDSQKQKTTQFRHQASHTILVSI